MDIKQTLIYRYKQREVALGKKDALKFIYDYDLLDKKYFNKIEFDEALLYFARLFIEEKDYEHSNNLLQLYRLLDDYKNKDIESLSPEFIFLYLSIYTVTQPIFLLEMHTKFTHLINILLDNKYSENDIIPILNNWFRYLIDRYNEDEDAGELDDIYYDFFTNNIVNNLFDNFVDLNFKSLRKEINSFFEEEEGYYSLNSPYSFKGKKPDKICIDNVPIKVNSWRDFLKESFEYIYENYNDEYESIKFKSFVLKEKEKDYPIISDNVLCSLDKQHWYEYHDYYLNISKGADQIIEGVRNMLLAIDFDLSDFKFTIK